MAFRMRRGLETEKPEPLRKRRKIEESKLLRNNPDLAEIDADGTMTADEKRIAIGKKILESAMEKTDDKAKVHENLQKMSYETEGKVRYRYGKKLRDTLLKNKYNNIKIKSIKGHRLSVTCIALDNVFGVLNDNKYCVTGSKDGSIIKWDLKTGKKLSKIYHAWPLSKTGYSKNVYKKIRPKPVLSIAISPDNKWLVSGGEDNLIRIWEFDTLRYKSTFKGHRNSVTCLGFSVTDEKSKTLFTAGFDRQIRVYDINEMGFAEQLYGHTMNINYMDTINDERCLTVSDDKTIRYWKLKTQSQIIFDNAHTSNIDTCCLITGNKFVTGSQDGNILLWSTTKKKPIFSKKSPHSTENGDMIHWITSLSCRQNTDVFSSGSSDGIVRLWLELNNSFVHIASIKVPKGGFINCMKFNNKGDKIICGIGTEHRFGRWMTCQGARNGICIIKLPVNCFYKERNDEMSADNTKNNGNANIIEIQDIKTDDIGSEKDKIKDKSSNDIIYNTAEVWDKWSKKDIYGGKIRKKLSKNKTNKKSDKSVDGSNDKNEWTDFFGEYFDA